MKTRHFKSLIDINTSEFNKIIQESMTYKALDKSNTIPRDFTIKHLQ